MVNIGSALAVALPLYSWPSSGVWDPVYQTIGSNSNTTFNIIINPNSGPGAFPPSSDYASAVAKLNAYENVNLYGYLHVEYTSKPISDVQSEVQTYAQWNSYQDDDLCLAGIFVDEAPGETDGLDYMAQVGDYIRSNMPENSTGIWTNPGRIVDPGFYDHADLVNTFEDEYVNWVNPERETIPWPLHNRSSVMILDYTGDDSDLSSQTAIIQRRGFQSGLIQGTGGYNAVVSLAWTTFAGAVAGA